MPAKLVQSYCTREVTYRGVAWKLLYLLLIPGVVSSRMDGSEPHHVVHTPTCGEARGMVPKLAKVP